VPRASVLIREAPWYRRHAFERGLAAVGFEISGNVAGRPGDVLVIWNRYGNVHEAATRFEREGGRVIVAENGYLGPGGGSPKFQVHPGGPKPTDYYSVSLDWHNGRGSWPCGGPERFRAIGVELKPWREKGSYVLICPNRSFGVGAQVMRSDWAASTARRLSRETKREIRTRAHPGNNAPQRSIEEDLTYAWAVVVWSSSVAVHSLLAGIPTFIEAPWQVLKRAGASGKVDDPIVPDRLPHFERMAWHQWTVKEIESGEPFRALLSAAGQGQVAVGA
jgi:hypothetical protein